MAIENDILIFDPALISLRTVYEEYR